jgi:histidinol-phosphate aminotransferase
MSFIFSELQQQNLLCRGFSRRSFGRVAALLAAGSVLPLSGESVLAQLSALPGGVPAGAVKIDANENPMGPCPEAIEAATAMVMQGGRYSYHQADAFISAMAKIEGLKTDYVRPYPGSSAPLHHAVLAFASPEKPLVVADPGYEAAQVAADLIGAKTIRVPLAKNHTHDVKAMAAASDQAGIIYVCNPNNPTGTLTPHDDIVWLVANKPKGCIVLVDEAYIHIAGAPTCSELVAQDKDLLILRTFSKIYGMAGLRAGAAMARPDLLKQLGQFTAGALPSGAMAAATASLKSANLVAERRKIITDIRENCAAFLRHHQFDVVPSVSNKFMVDVKRPAMEVVQAMRQENVYIGRVWQSWPTFCRVTVGTQEEMEIFQKAFLKVMA